MGDIVLFSPFGLVSALRVSLCLPWAMNRLAFQAASGEGSCTAICSEQTSTDDKPRAIASLLGIAEVRRRKTKVKIARNEFIEPTLTKKFTYAKFFI